MRLPAAPLAAPAVALLAALALAGCVVVEPPTPAPETRFPSFPTLVEDTPRPPRFDPATEEVPEHQGRRVCVAVAWSEAGLFDALRQAGASRGVSGPSMPLTRAFASQFPDVAAAFNASNALRQLTWLAHGSSFAVSPEAGVALMPKGTTQDQARSLFGEWAGAATPLDEAGTEEAWRRFWPTQTENGTVLRLRIPSVPLDPLGLWDALRAQGLEPVRLGTPGPDVSFAMGDWRFDFVLARMVGYWSTYDGNVTLEVSAADHAALRIEGIGMSHYEATRAWDEAWRVAGSGRDVHAPPFPAPSPC